MIRVFIFFCLFIGINQIATANIMRCDPYHNKPKNTLGNMGIFSENNPPEKNLREITPYNSADLMPDREVKEGGYWVQYFYLEKHRDHKLFLVCVYQKGRDITKIIPETFKICVLKYSISTTETPIFYCY